MCAFASQSDETIIYSGKKKEIRCFSSGCCILISQNVQNLSYLNVFGSFLLGSFSGSFSPEVISSGLLSCLQEQFVPHDGSNFSIIFAHILMMKYQIQRARCVLEIENMEGCSVRRGLLTGRFHQIAWQSLFVQLIIMLKVIQCQFFWISVAYAFTCFLKAVFLIFF